MRQFIKFLLSGGVAASLNWSSRFVFSLWMPFEYAVISSFFVGLISGYILMRFFVFKHKTNSTIRQMFKYCLVNIFALLQTLIISIFLVRWISTVYGVLEHIEAMAHFAGVLFPVITSYFGHKFLTFR